MTPAAVFGIISHMKNADLTREAKFVLDNWLVNPCGLRRRRKDCEECTDWKAPVRDDGYLSECYMQERTRRLIRKMMRAIDARGASASTDAHS